MKENGDHTESSTATTTSMSDAIMEPGINSGKDSSELAIDEDSSENEDLGPLTDDHHASFYNLEEDSGNEEDSDSSSEDENADLKSISRFKQQPSNGSMRRTDSLERFITRSERLSIIGKDKPPAEDEVAKRKVKFRPDEDLESIHILDHYTTDEDNDWKSQCFMTDSDFDRNDADMKLTHFRWQNHLNGTIRFDESENSLRGLEFMDRQEQLKKDKKKANHRKRVLEEAFEQKLKAQHHWDILRKASQEISAQSLEEARDRARRDHIDRCKAWGEAVCDDGYESDTDEPTLESSFGINEAKNNGLVANHQRHHRRKKKISDDKKKKKNPLLFWQK